MDRMTDSQTSPEGSALRALSGLSAVHNDTTNVLIEALECLDYLERRLNAVLVPGEALASIDTNPRSDGKSESEATVYVRNEIWARARAVVNRIEEITARVDV